MLPLLMPEGEYPETYHEPKTSYIQTYLYFLV
jgi:hypothetical protein